jgi:hypothetical protein
LGKKREKGEMACLVGTLAPSSSLARRNKKRGNILSKIENGFQTPEVYEV